MGTKYKKKSFTNSFVKFLTVFIAVFILYSIIIVLLLKWIDPPTTAFIQSKSTNSLFTSLKDYEYKWKSIHKVSLYYPLAVIASEDQRFFEHFGFDFEQIQKAMNEIEKGRRFRGASTISQQVAKNLFLWPAQNIFRKGLEAYYTVLIELLWTKKRILEMYINIAELGKNVYGIEAASRYYFNKSSERLTKKEAALIAVTLPRPIRRNPAKPSNYLAHRAKTIMKQMDLIGGVNLVKSNL